MSKRPNALLKNPKVKEKMEQVLVKVSDKKNLQAFRANLKPGEGTKRLLSDPDLKSMLAEIIDLTSMPEQHKEYIRRFFYNRWKPDDLFELINGRRPKSETESKNLADKILNSRAMEEFREVMRVFYASVLPVTATKKMELLLDPNTKGGVKLEVIKDIEGIAGVGGDQKPINLPYNVTITIPVQQNTQVNNKEGGE